MMGVEGQLQLRAALEGDLEGQMSRELLRIEASLQSALFEFATDRIQTPWRADIAKSGLRNAGRLSNTIRSARYRNSGMDPAALVYSRFPLLQRAFESDMVIRANRARWLTIPNPDVWPNGRINRGGRLRGSGASSFDIARQRFGELSFVPRPGEAALIVAKVRHSTARPGTFRKASASAMRTGRGLATVVVFFLVKEARLPRMLRGNVIRERAARNAPQEVDRRFIRNMERQTLALPAPEGA